MGDRTRRPRPAKTRFVVAFLVPGVLAFLLPLPVVAQTAPSAWPLMDATNDVRPFYLSQAVPVSAPPVRMVPFLDLTSLDLDDSSETSLMVRLKTAGGFRAPGTYGVVADYLLYFIRFRVGDSERLGIEFSAWLTADGAGAYPQSAALCNSPTESNGCLGGADTRLAVRVEDQAAVIELPKAFLVRASTPFGPRTAQTLPEAIHAGDRIEDIVAHANWYALFRSSNDITPRLMDRAPEEGGAVYAFKAPSNPSDLDVKPTRMAVVEGETTIVPVALVNDRGAKRLVNLTASILSSTPGSNWRLNVTPAAVLPGGKTTNVTLRVTADAIEATNRARIRLVVNILSEPGVRHISEWEFLAVPPWDAERNLFRIHGWEFGPSDAASGLAATYGLLTRAETEPGATDAGAVAMSPRFDFSEPSSSTLLRPEAPDGPREALPNPVTFRGGPARLHLEIEAPRQIDAMLRIMLESGDVPMGSVSLSRSFDAGLNVIDAEVPLNPKLNRLVPGLHRLSGQIIITDPSAAAFATGLALYAEPFKFRPRVSTLTLPIDREVEPVPREDLPRVGLAPSEDTDDYVNTGERIVFEADVRNEDRRAINVAFDADGLAPGWTAAVLPATEASLAPGGEVHLGLQVISPANATEGAFSFAVLHVRWKETGEELASQRFRITNTDGIVRVNETFEARTDDLDELGPPGDGRAPAPSAGLAFALVAAAAFYSASRRRA